MRKATGEDASYSKLVLAVEKKGVWMEELKAFHQYKKEQLVTDSVMVCRG